MVAWIFPAVVVVHAPVARISKHPVVNPDGKVIVAIAAVPLMITNGVVGAIVVADATVATEPFWVSVLDRLVNAPGPGVVAPVEEGLIGWPLIAAAVPDPLVPLVAAIATATVPDVYALA